MNLAAIQVRERWTSKEFYEFWMNATEDDVSDAFMLSRGRSVRPPMRFLVSFAIAKKRGIDKTWIEKTLVDTSDRARTLLSESDNTQEPLNWDLIELCLMLPRDKSLISRAVSADAKPVLPEFIRTATRDQIGRMVRFLVTRDPVAAKEYIESRAFLENPLLKEDTEPKRRDTLWLFAYAQEYRIPEYEMTAALGHLQFGKYIALFNRMSHSEFYPFNEDENATVSRAKVWWAKLPKTTQDEFTARLSPLSIPPGSGTGSSEDAPFSSRHTVSAAREINMNYAITTVPDEPVYLPILAAEVYSGVPRPSPRAVEEVLRICSAFTELVRTLQDASLNYRNAILDIDDPKIAFLQSNVGRKRRVLG